MSRPGILDLLQKGPVIGDGSAMITLEKRCYVMSGVFTPEAVIEYPDAVTQLQKEFIRGGSDVIQTVTFFSTSGRLESADSSKEYDCEELNQAACALAWEAVRETSVLVCGGLSPTPTYAKTHDKKLVQAEFNKQVHILTKNNVDFILGEFFGAVQEAEWAIEVMRGAGRPVACTLRCGLRGDEEGVSIGQCAVRMARAGADIIGINCRFDPTTSLKIITLMKSALTEAGLSPYLMIQPYGYHCPDVEDTLQGSQLLAENPLALEPRQITRIDAHVFARKAYELGVNYIGGCCGFEPYHIRAMAEELAEERGFRPPSADKSSPWGQVMSNHILECFRKKSTKEYWTSLVPSNGRSSPNCSGPTNGVNGSH